MINLNLKTNHEQFFAYKIKVEYVLEIINLWLTILQIPTIAEHASIIQKEDTLIKNIKPMLNNHVIDLMVMTTGSLQQNNGKYGRLKWRNEDNEWSNHWEW
jgi:hypothetical protein